MSIIRFEDLIPFGKLEDNILSITDSFSLERAYDGCAQCLLFTAVAAYEGDGEPAIEFDLTVDGDEKVLYSSPIYVPGVRGMLSLKQWRVPPMLIPGARLTVRVTVPEGTVLKLRSFAADYDSHAKDWNGGLRHNAHLGFHGMAKANTMASYELAALCGFPACIVNPRVTSDGVFVCMHNETINATARDENSLPPAEELAVKEMTYEELLKWDVGRHCHSVFEGQRIPKLDDFFALCSRTGMRPMFSTHPVFTTAEWYGIKALLKKHGILRNLHIKSFNYENLRAAYAVFGTEIDGYTWDRGDLEDTTVDMMRGLNMDLAKCRVGIEIRFRCYTAEKARRITDAGFFAAAYSVGKRHANEYRQLIEWGVTEFTEDNHCSMGLNW